MIMQARAINRWFHHLVATPASHVFFFVTCFCDVWPCGCLLYKVSYMLFVSKAGRIIMLSMKFHSYRVKKKFHSYQDDKLVSDKLIT